MKILILGIDGMIGHKIAQSLSYNYQVIGSTRKDLNIQNIGLQKGLLYKKDFLKDDYNTFLNQILPDVIINCIGVTTRRGISNNISNEISMSISMQFQSQIKISISISSRAEPSKADTRQVLQVLRYPQKR